MKRLTIYCGVLAASLIGVGFAGSASAAGGGNNECPVGLVNSDKLELDQEFGPGSEDRTRCLERRHKVKVVVQINQFCRDSRTKDDQPIKTVADCGDKRAFALGNIRNMINDYEITHGMEQGRDYEIVAIVHSGGGWLVLNDSGYDGNGNYIAGGRNKFAGDVSSLITDGVKFYFCQNTTRSFVSKGILPEGDEAGGATGELIPGVGYVTAGVTAIADFQSRGYEYVQP